MQDSQKRLTTNQIMSIVYAVIVILLLIASLFFSDAFSRDYLPEMTDYNGDWHDENGNVWQITDINVRDLGGSIILTKTLPYYIFDGDCICFESKNVNIKVSVGKRRVYDFNAQERAMEWLFTL